MAARTQQTFRSQIAPMERLRELWEFRDLIKNLVIRDLKVRYKHSVLGVLWSLLNPLLMMLVFTLVFQVMQPGNPIPHFAVFILTGLLPWNFFAGAVMGSAMQIVGNGGLIKKVYFPREVLPMSIVFGGFVNFLISFVPLAIFLLMTGIGFTSNVLWLPVIMVIHLLLLLGLGFLLSTLTVFYRDMLMVLDVAVLGLFFMTPIFYPMELIQEEASVFGIMLPVNRLMRWLNPMASIVDAYRTSLYGGIVYNDQLQPIYFPPTSPDPGFLLRTGVTALIIFIVGWAFFRHFSPRFGEEV
jgi:lipopolysaccharide transport system permease protein